MSTARASAHCATTIRWFGKSTPCTASLDRLRETAAIDAETAAAVDQLAASVGRQEELVERFKTCNALLHNSLSLFGRLSVSLASSNLGPAASAAAAAMLQLTLDTSAAAAREVEDRLDELAKQAASSDNDFVQAMLAHGRLLHDLLPAVDDNLKAIRAVPRRPDQEALRAMLLARKSASRTAARNCVGCCTRYRCFWSAASFTLACS